jgi:Uma2 family endonuclease
MDMEITALRPRRRFNVEDYYRMAEAGILGEDDRVELIEGEIVEMPPIGPAHGGGVTYLNYAFPRLVGGDAILSVQNPVRLSDLSEPVPDLMLLRPRPDFYRESHPGPDDVLLLIEVADRTAAFDRRVKLPLYARAGIREYWIVDLGAGLVEVHREAGPKGYAERTEFRPGDSVAPAAFPDAVLSVGDILGA